MGLSKTVKERSIMGPKWQGHATYFIGHCGTPGMSRLGSLLALTLVVVLLFATAGCIEVKDKPPQGPFTIEVESEEMFFVDDSGDTLHGPHGHLETEIAHHHEEYAWDIEGLGEFEGAEVDLPTHDVGVRKASYNVHFIDQENHTGLSVATVPDLSGIYFIIGDGTGLEEGDDSTETPVFDMLWGSNLTQVQSDERGTIMEFAGRLSEPMTLKLGHFSSTAEPSVYLVGIHVKSGDLLEEDTGSIRINPDEAHELSYLDGELSIKIWTYDEVQSGLSVFFNGTYEDLPLEYRTHIGALEWEGHVGEPEETPGFGALVSVLALTIAVFAVGARRR